MMQKFVIEYTSGDGFTWHQDHNIIIEATSKEEIYCTMVDYEADRQKRLVALTKEANAIREKYSVGMKDYEECFRRRLEAAEKHNRPDRVVCHLHGYDLSDIIRDLGDEFQHFDERQIFTLDEWVEKELQANKAKTG